MLCQVVKVKLSNFIWEATWELEEEMKKKIIHIYFETQVFQV